MDSTSQAGPRREEMQAFILAGGESRRVGRDKARLLVRGEPVARRLAARLGPHVSEVRLVAKRGQGLEDLGLPMLYDASEERALVHGIRAALQASGPAWRFLLACDMPDVDASVLRELWRVAHSAGAPGSCPQKEGCEMLEPLPSLWHARVARALRDDWGLAAQEWARRAGLAVWRVSVARAATLDNLNTPEKWRAYEGRAGAHP